jgi:hypothetical protein
VFSSFEVEAVDLELLLMDYHKLVVEQLPVLGQLGFEHFYQRGGFGDGLAFGSILLEQLTHNIMLL